MVTVAFSVAALSTRYTDEGEGRDGEGSWGRLPHSVPQCSAVEEGVGDGGDVRVAPVLGAEGGWLVGAKGRS